MSTSTQPQPQEHVFTLLPSSSLPSREVRNIRRVLKPFPNTIFRVFRPETWDVTTTWAIVSDHTPSLALLCSISSGGRVRLTRPDFINKVSSDCQPHIAAEAHQFTLPSVFAPVSTTVLWLGRLWLGAHAFWCAHQLLPFQDMKICLVGQMRPRGASGAAAPTTAIVKSLLIAAGAIIVSYREQPNFAIVASDLQPNTSKLVSALVQQNVLCLASAFVVDLLGRVNARPLDYCLFEQQRQFCGTLLDRDSILPLKSFSPVKGANRIVENIDQMENNGEKNDANSSKTMPTENKVDSKKPGDMSSSQQQVDGDKVKCDASTCAVPLKKRPRASSSQRQAPLPAPIPAEDKVENPNLSNGDISADEQTSVRKSTRSRKPTARAQLQEQKKRTHNTTNRKHVDEINDNENCAAIGIEQKQKETEQRNTDLTQSERTSAVTDVKNANRKAYNMERNISISHEEQNRSKKIICKLRIRPPTTDTVQKSMQTEGQDGIQHQPFKKHRCVASPVTPMPDRQTSTESQTRKQDVKNRISIPPVEVIDITSSPSIGNQNIRSDETKAEEQMNDNIQTPNKANHTECALTTSTTPRTKRKRRRIPIFEDSSSESACPEITRSKPNDTREITCKFAKEEKSSDKLPINHNQEPGPKRAPLNTGSVEGKGKVVDTVEKNETSKRNSFRSISDKRKTKDSRSRKSDQLDIDNITETLTIPSCTRPLDNRMVSIENAYEFLISKLGGEPNDADVERLKKFVDDESGDEDSEPIVLDEIVNNGSRNDGKQQFDDSPQLEEDKDSWLEEDHVEGINTQRRTRREERDANLSAGGSIFQTQSQYGTQNRIRRPRRRSYEPPDVMTIPIPKRTLVLPNAFLPEYIAPSNYDSIQIVQGHEDDDRICQGMVSPTDWMIAAENGVELLLETLQSSEDIDQRSGAGRVWVALFESKVLFRLISGSQLNEGETMTLSGICVRLVSSDPNLDRFGMLFESLLEVRQKQLTEGPDSMYFFLSSTHPEGILSRHRAVVTIWIALIQMSIRHGGPARLWEYFNKIMISRFEQLVSDQDNESRHTRSVVKDNIETITDVARVVGMMFTARLDLTPFSPEDADSGDENLFPDNWAFVCKCLQIIKKQARSSSLQDNKLLTNFLRAISLKLADSLWVVTSELLTVISSTIQHVYEENGLCSCRNASFQMASLEYDDNKPRINHQWISNLKTPCEFLMFLGWLYVTQSEGNVLKRVMLVLRLGAAYKKVPKATSNVNMAINHHVGLLLSISESLSVTNKHNEATLCKMLTSRSPRLDEMSQSPQSVDHIDSRWRVIIEAISRRCSFVTSRNRSVHVYVDWLVRSAGDIFRIVRKMNDSTSSIVAQREVLRVQESVLSNLIVLILTTASREIERTRRRVAAEELLAETLLLPLARGALLFMPQNIRICGDLLTQVHAAPGEALRKTRHHLLVLFLTVIAQGLQAFVQSITILPINQARNSFPESKRPDVLKIQDDPSTPFISNAALSGLLRTVLTNWDLSPDIDTVRSSHVASANVLVALVQYRWWYRSKQFSDLDVSKIAGFLVDMKYSVNNQQTQINVSKKSDQSLHTHGFMFELTFWSSVVKYNWASNLFNRNRKLAEMLVTSLVLIACDFNSEWTESEFAEIQNLLISLKQLQDLRHYFTPHVIEQLSAAIRYTNNSDEDRLSPLSVFARADLVESVFQGVLRQWPIESSRSFANKLRAIIGPVISRNKGRSHQDALLIYSTLFTLEAHFVGFRRGSNVRWIHAWFRDITDGLQVATRELNRHSLSHEAAEKIQISLLSSLCTIPNDIMDFETRTLVLRSFNTFGMDDTLSGIWKAGLSKFEAGQRTEWRQQAEKNLSAWKGFLFRSVIEDPLLGRPTNPRFNTSIQGFPSAVFIRQILRRLHSATCESFSQGPEGRGLRGAVVQLVGRIRGSPILISIENSIESSQLWQQILRTA